MKNKVDILAIGAHPDDVELYCSGTLIKEIQNGKTAGILDLTKGELGTRGTEKTRAKEAVKASKIIGIKERQNLNLGDGFFENSKENLIKIIEQIRYFRPEIILVNPLSDRHPDHGRCAKMVLESSFLSGLTKIETKYKSENQDKWRPKNIFHYIQWDEYTPDFIVDISETIDQKIEAVMAYESQFFNPNSKEPNTPISSQNFFESIKYRSKNFGRLTGVEYGEGFLKTKNLLVNSVFDFS